MRTTSGPQPMDVTRPGCMHLGSDGVPEGKNLAIGHTRKRAVSEQHIEGRTQRHQSEAVRTLLEAWDPEHSPSQSHGRDQDHVTCSRCVRPSVDLILSGLQLRRWPQSQFLVSNPEGNVGIATLTKKEYVRLRYERSNISLRGRGWVGSQPFTSLTNQRRHGR